MGVLTASGAMPDAAPVLKDPPPADDKTPAPQPEPKPEPERDFVPFSRIEKQQGSRREKAQREIAELIDQRVKPLEDKLHTEREQYEQRIQQQAQEIARLEGQYRALQERPAAPPPAPVQAPALPDPDRLIEEAETLLGNNDLRGYHRKWKEAQQAIAARTAQEQVTAARKEIEGRIPQQVDPLIPSLMAKYSNVALAGPRGAEAVLLKDRELGLYGTQPGPARMAKAFEMADEMLAKLNKPAPRPQFSQESAAALAGVPSGRNAAPAGAPAREPGYEPTDADKQVMRAMKWTADEFVKWKFPERWIKR